MKLQAQEQIAKENLQTFDSTSNHTLIFGKTFAQAN